MWIFSHQFWRDGYMNGQNAFLSALRGKDSNNVPSVFLRYVWWLKRRQILCCAIRRGSKKCFLPPLSQLWVRKKVNFPFKNVFEMRIGRQVPSLLFLRWAKSFSPARKHFWREMNLFSPFIHIFGMKKGRIFYSKLWGDPKKSFFYTKFCVQTFASGYFINVLKKHHSTAAATSFRAPFTARGSHGSNGLIALNCLFLTR